MPDGRQQMTLRDRVAGALIAAALRVMALLPLVVGQAIGRFVGACIYYLDTRAAKVTRTNIALCMPDLSRQASRQLARDSLSHTGQMLMESPAAWLGSIERVSGWIREVRNEALLNDALASRRGVVVVVPHIGNWELINAYFASRSPELGDLMRAGLYAPPFKAYMKEIMAEIRGRFGNEMVPTTTKGLAKIYRCLEGGGLTVILPDQVPLHGDFAPFFGIDCLTDRLVPRLVMRTHAAVVCCVIERLPRGRGFRIHFVEPHPDIYVDDLATSLKGLNESVERCVHVAPAQYQWEYKRFKERRAGELRVYNYENEPQTHHSVSDELRVTNPPRTGDKEQT